MGWLVFCHRCYGRWEVFRWAEWFIAWREHVLSSKASMSEKSRLLQWAWDKCPQLTGFADVVV